jgi:hypothetical protein
MDTREELHIILDDFDDEELFAAEMYLKGILSRRRAAPESDLAMERLRERGAEFRKLVERRWREQHLKTKASTGLISGLGGGGGFGFDLHGRPVGKMSYEYSYGGESFVETLRLFAGQEIEIRQRFALSGDGMNLLYEHAAESGGSGKHHQESFPFSESQR